MITLAYACFTDDGNQAAIIVTNLENGDTLGVCPDHLIDYSLGLLQSVSGLEWQPVLTDVADAGELPAADQAGKPAEPADDPTDPDPSGQLMHTGAHNDDDDQGDELHQLAGDQDADTDGLPTEAPGILRF